MKRFALTAVLALAACRTTSHPTQPSTLGVVRSSADLLAVIDQPGPIELTTVASADWAVDRSGLIDLSDPKAKEAKLEDGAEPIQVFFHVLAHPTKGTWWVDSGMEHAWRKEPERAAIRGLAAKFMNVDKLKVNEAPSEWLAAHPEGVKGVFFTHLHLDHVSGVPDLPAGTELYSGPGEGGASSFQNLVVQANTDRELEGKGTISEWAFAGDASKRFEGVIDVFGDGSLWALLVPGHTPGSTAYLARTTKGPVLLTGDTCHTH
jgi:glyoxylase-like metal-dependent hydrolase (beta-lactamase superfamily II)